MSTLDFVHNGQSLELEVLLVLSIMEYPHATVHVVCPMCPADKGGLHFPDTQF